MVMSHVVCWFTVGLCYTLFVFSFQHTGSIIGRTLNTGIRFCSFHIKWWSFVYCEAISSVEVKQFLLLFLRGPSVSGDPPGCRWQKAQLFLGSISPCKWLKPEARWWCMSCLLGLDFAPFPAFHLCFPLRELRSYPSPAFMISKAPSITWVARALSCAGAKRMSAPTSSTCEIYQLQGHGLSALRPGAIPLWPGLSHRPILGTGKLSEHHQAPRILSGRGLVPSENEGIFVIQTAGVGLRWACCPRAHFLDKKHLSKGTSDPSQLAFIIYLRAESGWCLVFYLRAEITKEWTQHQGTSDRLSSDSL